MHDGLVGHDQFDPEQHVEKLTPESLEKCGVVVVDSVGGRFETDFLVSKR